MMGQARPIDEARGIAQQKIEEIVRSLLEEINARKPEMYNTRDSSIRARVMAEKFMLPPGDEEGDNARKAVLALATAMNPRSPYEQGGVYDSLEDEYQDELGPKIGTYALQSAPYMSDPNGNVTTYEGPGWTEKQENGRTPGKWELSPGDYHEYQRLRNTHAIEEVARLNKIHHTAESGEDPLDAMRKRAMVAHQLRQAVNAHTKSAGERYASGFFGSNYQWHQSQGALRDALSNPDSPIASYMQIGQSQSDVPSYAGMTNTSPVDAVPSYYEANNHWSKTSPRGIPDFETTTQQEGDYIRSVDPVEQKINFLNERRGDLTKASPPNFSEWYWAKVGAPPSYFSQGSMNFLNNIVSDITTPVSIGATRGVNYVMQNVGKSAIPGVGAYGRHIARKTAVDAARPFASAMKSEMVGDAYPSAGMQGLTTAYDDAPPFSQWFIGGVKSRPDLNESTNSVAQKIKDYDAELPKVIKRQDYWSKQHPNSYANGNYFLGGLIQPVADAVGYAAGSWNAGLENTFRDLDRERKPK